MSCTSGGTNLHTNICWEQLCREGHGGPGGHQVEDEPVMSPSSKRSLSCTEKQLKGRDNLGEYFVTPEGLALHSAHLADQQLK